MSSSLKAVDITIPMPWGPISGRTYGNDQSTPVLCVHGRQDNLETFCHLLPFLPPNFYYVFIDLPNHGKSAHADIGYITDFLWYTMSTKRVIDHFKWSKLFFIGHSLGGQIGFYLASMYPELFLKLVIIDSLMFNHLPTLKTSRALRDFVFDPILKLERRISSDQAPTYSLTDFAQKMKEGRRTEVSVQQILPMAERNLSKIGPDQYKYSNDQRVKIIGPVHFSFEQLEGIASEIKCPTLLVLGQNSLNTTPLDKISRTPLKHNQNVTFRILEGDHDLHIAHPKAVADVIVPFLTSETLSKL